MRVLDNGLSFEDLANLTFIYRLAGVVEPELVATSAHAKDFESVNFGDEAWRWHDGVVKVLEEDMGETSPEVGSINVELLLPWQVHVHAAGAVDFHA